MSSYLDILSGTIIGGMVMLIALTASDLGLRRMYNHNADEILQSNLKRITQVIEFDLRKMGFGVPDDELPNIIQIKDPDRLKFLVQLNMDTDTFYPAAGITTTDTQVDTLEYRIQNGTTITIADSNVVLYEVVRLVKFNGAATQTHSLGFISNNDVFTYLDQAGNETSLTPAVRMIEISLAALNPQVMITPELVSASLGGIADEDFRRQELLRLLQPAYWQNRRLISRNLFR